MNPIRTLGPAVAAGNYRGLWIYLVAPTLGALAGAAAYTTVKLPDNIPSSNQVRGASHYCLLVQTSLLIHDSSNRDDNSNQDSIVLYKFI